MRELIDQTAQWISGAKAVVVFAGAGLSTESGIPDFRSPGGVWDRYNPEDFYFQNFLASEASREKYWQMATEMYEPMKPVAPVTKYAIGRAYPQSARPVQRRHRARMFCSSNGSSRLAAGSR